MKVSLRRFLETGELGQLHLGMTEQAVRDLLGVPDDVGGTSRKYKRPCILKYGCVRIAFTHSWPAQCTGLHVCSPDGKEGFAFPSNWTIEDWDLVPGMDLQKVEEYLNVKHFNYRHHELPAINHLIVISSQISIVFDNENKMWGVAIGS